MDMDFLLKMRDVRQSVSEYPEGEMRLDNADFIKLVNIAEYIAQEEDKFKTQLLAEVTRQRDEIMKISRLLDQEKAETYDLTFRLGIALKLMNPEQRAKIADMVENWTISEVIDFMRPEEEDE